MQNYKKTLSDMNEKIDLNLIKLVYRAVAEEFITVRYYFVALASIELTLEYNPESAEDYRRQGEVFRMIMLFEEAMTCFDKAIELNDKSLALKLLKNEIEVLNYI